MSRDVRGAGPDPVNGSSFLSVAYAATDPSNSDLDAFSGGSEDLYPPELRAEIDAVNERVYATVNNGVYRAGFATTQAAYEHAIHFKCNKPRRIVPLGPELDLSAPHGRERLAA